MYEEMEPSALSLQDIPNEILVSILSSFHTHALLPLTLVSYRFHNLILRILHYRLLLAASAPEYKIILEAYLPSRRYTRPYLFCEYLGTDGLSSKIEGKGSLYEDLDENGAGVSGRLGRLGGLYSRFRPEFPDVEGKMPVRRIAGAAPNLQSNTDGLNLDWFSAPGPSSSVPPLATTNDTTSTNPSINDGTASASGVAESETTPQSQTTPQNPGGLPQSQPLWANRGDGGNKKVVYTLNFDAGELFGQFCAAATLVRLGPRRGVFLSSVPVVEDKQGVIRVWREWLLNRAKVLIELELSGVDIDSTLERTSTDRRSEDMAKDKNVLWTDYRRNVGIKLAVRERQIAGVPARALDEDKDDIPLSFDIEIRELVVRTTHLMLAVEESQELQKQPGKALIFGNFAVAASS